MSDRFNEAVNHLTRWLAASRSELPPLRIHHLMMWMAVAAVLISGCLAFDRTIRNGPMVNHPVVIGALLTIAIAVSGAITCLCWGGVWRGRGVIFPAEPGEWLAAAVSIFALGYAAILVLSLVAFLIHDDFFPVAWIGLRAAMLLGLMIMSLYVARVRSDTLAWRVLFVLLALSPLMIWMVGIFTLSCLQAIALVTASWNDVRRSKPRRWTHWFGVGVFLALLLSCIAITTLPATEHSPITGYFR